MDGKYEVYHYTEILKQLLKEGSCKPVAQTLRLSYHDSVFWGGITISEHQYTNKAGAR